MFGLGVRVKRKVMEGGGGVLGSGVRVKLESHYYDEKSAKLGVRG